eukprot:158366_1
MNIEHIDSDNYEAVSEFLKKENEDINDWNTLLKEGLFKLCVLNKNGEINGIFIFEDYPYSLQNKYEFICKSNWENWLKNYFEITNENYHTLWLVKWYIIPSKKEDIVLLQLVLSSIFISNFEIESILLSKNANIKNDESSFDILFNRLHRIHRNNNTIDNESLSNKIDLFYCLSSKLLPNIDIR